MSLVEKLRLITFDLDGTLIRTNSRYYVMQFRRALIHFGKLADELFIRKLWFDDNRSKYIRDLGIDSNEFWKHYNSIENLESRKKNIRLYSFNDRAVIRKLRKKGIKTAVITGTTEKVMGIELGLFGKELFDACYSTYSPRAYKRDKIIECMARFGAASDSCMHVGNSDGDVAEPRIYGVKSVLIERNEYPAVEKPDYKIQNLKDILELA
jgi:FMN phosphatase YigB (HAD superfamily)